MKYFPACTLGALIGFGLSWVIAPHHHILKVPMVIFLGMAILWDVIFIWGKRKRS